MKICKDWKNSTFIDKINCLMIIKVKILIKNLKKLKNHIVVLKKK